MGINVQLALSTKDAERLLNNDSFDLLISNVYRTGEDNPNIPLKNCPVVYSAFPNGYNDQNKDMEKFNIEEQARPRGGFAMAEAFSQTFPELFGDTQVPRIIFYSASVGGKVADQCARIVTNRPDMLLQTVVSALEELRWNNLVK